MVSEATVSLLQNMFALLLHTAKLNSAETANTLALDGQFTNKPRCKNTQTPVIYGVLNTVGIYYFETNYKQK